MLALTMLAVVPNEAEEVADAVRLLELSQGRYATHLIRRQTHVHEPNAMCHYSLPPLKTRIRII